MSKKVIYAEDLLCSMRDDPSINGAHFARIRRHIEAAPAVEAVPLERYNDLREDFVDYVCSGASNVAPYCKNRCDECVDRGWCTYKRCNGFNPDGRGADNG